MKKILILGVTGQDGSYMADFLLKKKILVHAVIRKSATGNTKNIQHIINDSKIFAICFSAIFSIFKSTLDSIFR